MKKIIITSLIILLVGFSSFEVFSFFRYNGRDGYLVYEKLDNDDSLYCEELKLNLYKKDTREYNDFLSKNNIKLSRLYDVIGKMEINGDIYYVRLSHYFLDESRFELHDLFQEEKIYIDEVTGTKYTKNEIEPLISGYIEISKFGFGDGLVMCELSSEVLNLPDGLGRIELIENQD